MKIKIFALAAVIAVALTAAAQTGPTSPLYLTGTPIVADPGPDIIVVQGNSIINSFPQAYGSPTEGPIAVFGDVRTTNFGYPGFGGQYTLAGIPTGTSYSLPGPPVSEALDSTTDGIHNFLVEYPYGGVYQTDRDFTNPVLLFSVARGYAGITYDPVNHSLWISTFLNHNVADYSLSGTFLSSFYTADPVAGALAFDPADHTLWLVDYYTGNLEQYSTAGALLSTGPNVGYALGGEFNEATPEPGTLVMFGSGIIGLAGVLRRKINH